MRRVSCVVCLCDGIDDADGWLFDVLAACAVSWRAWDRGQVLAWARRVFDEGSISPTNADKLYEQEIHGRHLKSLERGELASLGLTIGAIRDLFAAIALLPE
jgi:hypothetical protein